MTRIGQLNRKGSGAREDFLLRWSGRNRYAEAILEKSGVARRQDSRRFSLIDFDHAHGRALPNPVDTPGKALKIIFINDDSRIRDPAAARRRRGARKAKAPRGSSQRTSSGPAATREKPASADAVRQ